MNNFNPRLREGGDRFQRRNDFRKLHFNPRLREGGDYNAKEAAYKKMLISIHASAKEATIVVRILYMRVSNFNPRLREGGDLKAESSYLSEQISIHASAKEATMSIYKGVIKLYISIHASAKEATAERFIKGVDELFQSTPPRRRRRNGCRVLLDNRDFNPRLREGGDRNIL